MTKLKIIVTVFVFWIAGINCCGNQLLCMQEDPLGFLLEGTNPVCPNDTGIRTKYMLYTTEGKEEIKPDTILDNTKPIKVILSGQGANGETPVINAIIQAYLKVHKDAYNIIVPDYALYFPESKAGSYEVPNPFCNVTSVSHGISEFLYKLVINNNIDPQKIHIIGSSLGGQLCGFVGLYFKQLTNQPVGRITGVDPGSIGFTCPSYPDCRLDETDATYVDILYTDYGFLGVPIKSGHVQFLVNNGRPAQPGCEDLEFSWMHRCNHLLSNTLFTESILYNNFRGHCLTDPDDEEVVYMGEYCRERPKCSTFKVVTNDESPYGVDPSGPITT